MTEQTRQTPATILHNLADVSKTRIATPTTLSTPSGMSRKGEQRSHNCSAGSWIKRKNNRLSSHLFWTGQAQKQANPDKSSLEVPQLAFPHRQRRPASFA